MKGKGVYVPVSQLNRNESVNFETSTSTSTTALAVPVIEERVQLLQKNPEEIKKCRPLAARTRYIAKKKATK